MHNLLKFIIVILTWSNSEVENSKAKQ